jgi:hypothetical protein
LIEEKLNPLQEHQHQELGNPTTMAPGEATKNASKSGQLIIVTSWLFETKNACAAVKDPWMTSGDGL